MVRCKLDKSNCASMLELYNNETGARLKTLNMGTVRCDTGTPSYGKWYWEIKRNNYCVADGSVYPHVHTMIQMGVISEDTNHNWDDISGFTSIAGWSGLTSGTGIHYMCVDYYGGIPSEYAQSVELLATSNIGIGGVVVTHTVNQDLAKSLYTKQKHAIGFMIDLDNSILTICTGNTKSLNSANSISVDLPIGNVYYPAVALWNDNQVNLDTYGPLEVQCNFGESGPFELGLPDGYKPYYMAYKYSYDDLKIY